MERRNQLKKDMEIQILRYIHGKDENCSKIADVVENILHLVEFWLVTHPELEDK